MAENEDKTVTLGRSTLHLPKDGNMTALICSGFLGLLLAHLLEGTGIDKDKQTYGSPELPVRHWTEYGNSSQFSSGGESR